MTSTYKHLVRTVDPKVARSSRVDIYRHLGASTALTLEQAPAKVQEICDTAKSVNPNIIVLCHGDPISMPDDAEYVLRNTEGVDGFYGASSVERLPTEIAITEQMKKFKSIRFQ